MVIFLKHWTTTILFNFSPLNVCVAYHFIVNYKVFYALLVEKWVNHKKNDQNSYVTFCVICLTSLSSTEDCQRSFLICCWIVYYTIRKIEISNKYWIRSITTLVSEKSLILYDRRFNVWKVHILIYCGVNSVFIAVFLVIYRNLVRDGGFRVLRKRKMLGICFLVPKLC